MKNYILFLLLSSWSYSLHAQAFWQQIDLKTAVVNDLFLDNQDRVYINSRSGFWRSSDQGKTWSVLSSQIVQRCGTNPIVVNSSNLFCKDVPWSKVWMTLDDGQTWDSIKLPSTYTGYFQLGELAVSRQNTLLLMDKIVFSDGRTEIDFYELLLPEKTWRKLTDSEAESYRTKDGYYYKLANKNEVNVFQRYNTSSGTTTVLQLSKSIVAWRQNNKALLLFDASNQMYQSTDSGDTWAKVVLPTLVTKLQFDPDGSPYFVISGFDSDERLRKYYSEDGLNWREMPEISLLYAFSNDMQFYYLGKDGKVYRQSLKNFSENVSIYSDKDQINISTIIYATNSRILGLGDGKIFRSDAGGTFQRIEFPLKDIANGLSKELYFTDLFKTNDGVLYAVAKDQDMYGILNGSIYRSEYNEVIDSAIYESKDNGNTWQSLQYPSVKPSGGTQVGTSSEQWIPVGISKLGNFYFEQRDFTNQTATLIEAQLAAGGQFSFLKKIMGTTTIPLWPIYQVLETATDIYVYIKSSQTIFKQNNNIFEEIAKALEVVATSKGIILLKNDGILKLVSLDEGKTWSEVPCIHLDIPAPKWTFSVNFTKDSQDNIWYTCQNASHPTLDPYPSLFSSLIFVDSKSKESKVVDEALQNIKKIFTDDKGYLYAQTSNGTFRSTSAISSVAITPIDELPSTFSTSAAYPNPFSQNTTFGVLLPKASRISIGIYNMLGQRIHTLSDVDLPAGTHSFDWQAADVPSGVYFARIAADGKVRSQKLIVVH